MKSKEYWKQWMKAAGVRAVKTMAQAFIALTGTAVVMKDVDWFMVLSASALSGIVSLVTSLAGLPEIKVPEKPEEEE